MQIRKRNEEGMGRGRKKTFLSFSFSSKFKFIYSHLFSYNVTTIKNKKEVKNRADYTLS